MLSGVVISKYTSEFSSPLVTPVIRALGNVDKSEFVDLRLCGFFSKSMIYSLLVFTSENNRSNLSINQDAQRAVRVHVSTHVSAVLFVVLCVFQLVHSHH